MFDLGRAGRHHLELASFDPMPAKHRSTYRSQPRGKAKTIPRLHLALSLTASEIRKLQALAAQDTRPMSECITGLVSKHLARKRWTAPQLAASRRVRRFEVATRIPKDELARRAAGV
jgi:hypothetical protein